MKPNDKIYIENRAEPPALPCCVVRPSSSSSTSSFGPTRRRSALLVVIRPSSSSFGSPPRHGALCIVIRPSPSALPLILGPYALLFGLVGLQMPAGSCQRHRWTYYAHVRLPALWRGSSSPRGAICVMAAPYVLSLSPLRYRLGPPRRCWAARVVVWALCVVVGPLALSFGPPHRY